MNANQPRSIWRILAALLMAFGLALTGLPGVALAAADDSTIRIQNMSMDLRPEYDTSDVLIIYDFTLTNTGSTPYEGEIRFHVPKGATNQVHICEQKDGNKHAICRPYQTADAGDSTLMSWKPSQPIQPGQSYPIYVEYYYNPIQGSTDKAIDFFYHPSYPVETLQLSVVQPLRSSNWQLDPAPSFSGGTGDGMTRYSYTMQNLSAEKPVNLSIRYTKADNNPSVAKKPTDASAVTGMSTGGKIALGSVVVALFGALLFLGLRPSSGKRPTHLPHHQGAPRKAAPPSRTAPRRAEPPRRSLSVAEQKQQARALLLEGKITEATYQEIMADLTGEAR